MNVDYKALLAQDDAFNAFIREVGFRIIVGDTPESLPVLFEMFNQGLSPAATVRIMKTANEAQQ